MISLVIFLAVTLSMLVFGLFIVSPLLFWLIINFQEWHKKYKQRKQLRKNEWKSML